MDQAIWDNDIFKLALEASPSGQLIIDHNGFIKHINSKVIDIFGYQNKELISQPLEVLIPQEYRKQHPNYRENFHARPAVRAMGSGKILYGLHKNNNKIPVEIGLNPLEYDNTKYVLASVVDISERLKAEQRFQLALEASPNGVLLMNDTGNIVLVNSKIEEIFGYTRDELVNHSIGILVPNSHRSDHPQYINHFFTQPQSRAMGTGRDLFGLRKNGKQVPLEIGLNPLEIAGVNHVLASVVDISERKQADLDKQSLNNQIQHAQRLESLGILAGGTAHDFNNILQSISANAELVSMNLEKNGDVKPHINNIITSCRRASDLTRQMLAYAGKGKLLCTVENINSLTNDITTLLRSSISKQISVHLQLSDDLPLIEVDRSQIQQVIMNLITNSSEAIGDNSGEITIKSGVSYESSESLKEYKYFDHLEEGKYLYLEINDSGCGMTKQTLENMFDPFFTTKFTGRGLGMAAVLGIIRGHSGTVKVESEINKGTTIKIILPLPEQVIDNLENAKTQGVEKKLSAKVLVIDDEKGVRDTLQQMLELDSFSVSLAESGSQGLDIIEQSEDGFDLICLDMNMPGISGAEVYAELDKRKIKSEIILMSGYNADEVTSAIKKLTGHGDINVNFLAKPFVYEDLRQQISVLLPDLKIIK